MNEPRRSCSSAPPTTPPARSPRRSSSSPRRPSRVPNAEGRDGQRRPPRRLAAALGMTQPPTAATCRERLLADTSLLSHVLGRLSRDLPVTPVLVIDQAEEMFTLARSPVEEWGRGRVLEMIRQVGDRQRRLQADRLAANRILRPAGQHPASRPGRGRRRARVPARRPRRPRDGPT